MFESLKEIEGLNDDTIKAIEEKLQPEIEKNFNANYGKTLGEIDEFIQDFTGVQKKDNQFTSKYIKEALPLWRESYDVDSKKKASESWEQEKAEYMQQLEKVKDRDKIYADYQSTVQAYKELEENKAKEIEEIKTSYENKFKLNSIQSQLPNALNSPLLAPWREKVSALILESGVEIKDGKVSASEATGGMPMTVEKFIVKHMPELKEAFEKQDNSLNSNENSKTSKDVLITDATSLAQLDQLIREKVMRENGWSDRTHKDFPKKFKAERDKHREQIELLSSK